MLQTITWAPTEVDRSLCDQILIGDSPPLLRNTINARNSIWKHTWSQFISTALYNHKQTMRSEPLNSTFCTWCGNMSSSQSHWSFKSGRRGDALHRMWGAATQGVWKHSNSYMKLCTTRVCSDMQRIRNETQKKYPRWSSLMHTLVHAR